MTTFTLTHNNRLSGTIIDLVQTAHRFESKARELDHRYFDPINEFITDIRNLLTITAAELCKGLTAEAVATLIIETLVLIGFFVALVVTTAFNWVIQFVAPVVKEAQFWITVVAEHCADPYAGSDMAIELATIEYQTSVENATLAAQTHAMIVASQIRIYCADCQTDTLRANANSLDNTVM